MRHDEPRYYGYWRYYKGGYASITKCSGCGCIALYEDAHPVNPCKHCGGRVSEVGSAKWEPPVTRWEWLRRVTVTPGRWVAPNAEFRLDE